MAGQSTSVPLEVLIRLCRRPGEEISQRQLADDLTLTSSGTTRLIDRMEDAGLVRRVPSAEDRRVALVETDPRRTYGVPAGGGRTRAAGGEVLRQATDG